MWDKRSDMIIHEHEPFNAEPAPHVLAIGDITPVDTFYSRNHGPIPAIAADDWRLEVGGRVSRPHVFTLDEIRHRFATHAVTATLQCAGNRRSGLIDVHPIPGEDPWGSGAVSTAEWRGARLADILDAVGADDGDDLHVAFQGPDVSQLASPPQPFGGSIDIAKARSSEVLLAWGMNCEPLPRIHGGPVRVVVPGYIGARSVKWVTTVTVIDAPSDNYFQASAYRILAPDADPDHITPGDGIPLSTLAVNCDVLTHTDGDSVPAGLLTIGGYAQPGSGHRIARIDVSIDGGTTWNQADIDTPYGRWAWCRWTYTLCGRPGPLPLVVRAFDDTAATQPESAAAVWNPKGYMNNSWARLTLDIT
jgi:sulfite oxidase